VGRVEPAAPGRRRDRGPRPPPGRRASRGHR
jgi:hypothetical protein